MPETPRQNSTADADDTAEPTPRDEAVAQQIEEIPAADGADVMEGLSYADAADVAEYLDPDTAGRILSEMDPQAAAHVLDDMETPEASLVVASMDPDDRVDVLEHVSDEVHDAIVKELNPQDRADVENLEQYPPESAGGIMTSQVTSLPEDMTVALAIEELRRLNEEYEQMFYVYVVDRRQHLVGVLSMRDLILSKPDRKVHQIMRTDVARVPMLMDQEQVARVMRRNNYMAMPVVDDYNRLVGLITGDDIVDVIQDEATEDVQKMFGAGPDERLSSPWGYSFRQRIGWLEINLATAFLAAWIISRFNTTIAALPVLVAYQSIVAAMGGTAGAQSLAVAIRGIALGEGGRGMLLRAFYREGLVGLLSGLIVGVITGGAAALGVFGGAMHGGYNPYALAGVVAAALVVNHFIACTSGVVIPFTVRRLGLDPSQSATIWATTVSDFCGFLATLGIAQLCIKWLVRP